LPKLNLARISFASALLVFLVALIPLSGARAAGQDVADEIFYHYMPICWRDADNDIYRFGDFGGMTDALPYLSDLGVTAVWMNPVFPSPAYHGYQHGRADLLNARFGTEAEFIAFIEAAHARGIKVFVDFVAYGISFDSPWFQDAYNNPASPYDDWLAFTNSANTDYQGSFYNTWDGAGVGHIWWDLRNPNAVSLVTEWAAHWLDPNADGNFSDGLDGYRLDHVWRTYPYGPDGWGYHIDSFWANWRTALRTVNPEVFLFGEQANWGSQGVELLVGLDAAFTKPFEFAARDALRWEYASALYQGIGSASAALSGATHPGTLLATIGNHDVDRLATSIGDDFEKGKVAAAVLLTQPFPPVIYHGDEIGMRGAKTSAYGGDASDIPMREPFKWNAVAGPPMSNYDALHAAAFAGRVSQNHDGRSVEEQYGVSGSLLTAYRQLISLRTNNVALRRGGYHPVPATDGGVWAFVRDHDDQQVLVVINVTGGARSFALDLGGFDIPGDVTQPIDLLGGPNPGVLTVANRETWPLNLGPYDYVVLELDVVPPPPPVAVVDGRNIPADFGVSKLLATQASPTHLGDNNSELDQFFARVAGDSLFVGLTGNLATDGTGLALLLDLGPGGQNTLNTGNLSPPPSGPEHLTGLRLDAGFEPEVMLFVNAFAGTIYMDRYDLVNGGGAIKTYLGQGVVNNGLGLLSGGDNAFDTRVALDNTNTSGVSDVDVVDAAGATVGSEWSLSLAGLGHTGGDLKLAAFLMEADGAVSNQWLPPLNGVTGSLGVAPDLTIYAGDQFAALNPATAVPDGDPFPDFTVTVGNNGGHAVIAFRLPAAAPVHLTVLDVRGRIVQRLLEGELLAAGERSVRWDGRDGTGRMAASGVYLFRLLAGSAEAHGRIVLVR